MINVLIGGDVCPIGKNLPYFRDGDAESIFNDLLKEFHEADLSIVNLECPLVDRDSPIQKTGPNLRVPTGCIAGFQQAKIDVVTLANNHIMDHGPEGLKNTLKEFEKAGISTVGAGKNLTEARQMLIKKINNIRIGILGIAEHEFSIATENSWGANPLDLIDYVRNIKSNEGNFDYLIVLFHGGNEHYPFPSPRLKKACHFLVEMGADAVIIQHTHCPGCYETYRNSYIIYGQGNLIFDMPNSEKSFYEGFLVRLSIEENLQTKMKIIPYIQSHRQTGTMKMDKNTEQLFRDEIERRSCLIADDAFVLERWIEFCRNKEDQYLNRLTGHNRILKLLNKYGLFVKFFSSDIFLYRLQNIICCESHREGIETILSHRLYK